MALHCPKIVFLAPIEPLNYYKLSEFAQTKIPEVPLAERIRPKHLDDIVGQEHLVGKQGILRRMLLQGSLPSLLFWGPPGVGKTTLAKMIAAYIKVPFYTLSAISAGVKEVREIIQKAERRAKTLLFIDEIHRFNKSQQDALLGAVERGFLTLIGATTENPSFEINAALRSRCQVYTLKPLTPENLRKLLSDALERDVFLSKKNIEIAEYEALFYFSQGDARRLLNLLEMAIYSTQGQSPRITNAVVEKVALQKQAFYDKSGDQHYDIVSAFIKSLRGSDPNAAVYWLARMIAGGEDAKFIARRMLILASEDVGNANPTALVLATNCFQAVSMVGYPEAEIILSQTATYLAASPKSNAAYLAIRKAKALVKETGDLPVPLHLRNAPTAQMKAQGYGKNYKYAHDYTGNFVAQPFFPPEIDNTRLYEPGKNPREETLRKYLKNCWKDKYGY